ncbi:MAG TPA: S8 family serine peptidase [Pseudoduganella sp.]
MPTLRPTYSLLRSCRCLLLALGLLAGAGPAAAQIGLPGLPQLPGGLPSRLGDNAVRDRLREKLLDTTELPRKVLLDQLRLLNVRELLHRHPAHLEPDPSGFPIVRREILAWSPSEAGLAAAGAAGLTVASRQEMPEAGQALVTLRVPDGVATADALARLRAADPDGSYDFNHVYTGAKAAGANEAADGAPAAAPAGRATGVRAAPREAKQDKLPARAGGDGTSPVGSRMASSGAGATGAVGGEVRVGLVDSGIDGRHEVFENARIVRWGCDGATHPAPHGTAVGALMIGKSERFTGAAPGARLYAADIYCDQPTGGSASQIVQALAWLAKEQVGVINISLVGPPNQMLGRVVQAMVARGHLLVAAVGNDGPAAPPLYPASYPGVVGVTGIDPNRKPLPEAARGPQVMFAAPGSQMAAAAIGTPPYKLVRGTSFASPLVAALLAPRLPSPSTAMAGSAVTALAATAVAAGDGTGRGVVAENLRIPPSAFR